MKDSGATSLNLHIYPNTFRYESRMLKETKSIVEFGLADQVHILAMAGDNLPERERIDGRRQVWRIKLAYGGSSANPISKLIRILEWQARVYWQFRRSLVVFVNCHSLATLPVGVLFKALYGARFVYDTHELETEVIGAGRLRRALSKLAERLLIHAVDWVFVVNESIAAWYRREYNLDNVTTVRNIPDTAEPLPTGAEPNLRQRFGLGERESLFLYQGALGKGRSIDLLLDVFKRLDRGKHIVFMGFGEWAPAIQDAAQAFSNIHFHPAVSPRELGNYTRGADAGLCLIENACLSFYLSLPNKLFEYVMNGVPVIVSDFPEMGRVIDEGHCGWKVPVDREALFQLVSRLAPKEIDDKRRGALEFRQRLSWRNEEQAMVGAYRRFIRERVAPIGLASANKEQES